MGTIFAIICSIISICILIYCINRFNRAAVAAEECSERLKRLVQINEAVVRTEHPELFKSSETGEAPDKIEEETADKK